MGEPLEDNNVLSIGGAMGVSRTKDLRHNIKGPSSNALFFDLHVSSVNWSSTTDTDSAPFLEAE